MFNDEQRKLIEAAFEKAINDSPILSEYYANLPARPIPAAVDKTVSQEYLDWLSSIGPRIDVSGNVAWNAGVEWAINHMMNLSPKEVYDLIRNGAADGGWQGFAIKLSEAMKAKK